MDAGRFLKMRNEFWFLLFSLTFFSNGAFATNLEKVLSPLVVSIDRRPNKDLNYSKCVGMFFVSDDIQFPAAVDTISDRTCPAPRDISVDVSDHKSGYGYRAETDSSKTVSEILQISDSSYRKQANYKGKVWKFTVKPYRVSVSIPRASDPTSDDKDTFCLSRAVSVEQQGGKPEKLLVACEDCSTLQACLDSRFETKAPLAVGKKSSSATPHGRQVAIDFPKGGKSSLEGSSRAHIQ